MKRGRMEGKRVHLVDVRRRGIHKKGDRDDDGDGDGDGDGDSDGDDAR